MAHFQMSWDAPKYPDGSAVVGQVMHVEAKYENMTGWNEVVVTAVNATTAEFDFDVPAGQTLDVRTRAEVAGQFSDYSEVVTYISPFPVPAPTGLKLTFVHA